MVNWLLMALPLSTIAGLLPTINKLTLCLKGGNFDPKLGRDNLQASKAGLDTENFAKIIRCANAESNFYENWPVYAAGVVRKPPYMPLSQKQGAMFLIGCFGKSSSSRTACRQLHPWSPKTCLLGPGVWVDRRSYFLQWFLYLRQGPTSYPSLHGRNYYLLRPACYCGSELHILKRPVSLGRAPPLQLICTFPKSALLICLNKTWRTKQLSLEFYQKRSCHFTQATQPSLGHSPMNSSFFPDLNMPTEMES